MSDLGELREALRRGARWYAHHGFKASLDKMSAVLADRRSPSSRSYEKWRRASAPGRHRGETLRISILVPVKDPAPQHLDELYRSVRDQDHERWELVFVDDGSVEPVVGRRLAALAAGDPRVSVHRRDMSGGISVATNAAASHARGDVLVFVDHDDRLGREVLGQLAAAFREDPTLDLVYTDEDQLTPWGARTAPVFKPGPSPWLALGFNYLTHLLAIRRSLFEALGGVRTEFDGAQDHDLVLRALERARRVRHLPLVGYHWRRTAGSVASSSTAKPWAFQAGRRAVQDACRRRRLPVGDVLEGTPSGVYELRLEPPPSPRPVHVVLHGPDARCRPWLDRFDSLRDVLVVRGGTSHEWPSSPGGEDVLVIDARSSTNDDALRELLAWTSLPDLGAVCSASLSARRRRHIGYSVRSDGRADPILPGLSARAVGPGLLGASQREIAGSPDGVIWVRSPSPSVWRHLAGRPVDAAGILALSMANAAGGRPTLFLPRVAFEPEKGRQPAASAIDLSRCALWDSLRRRLPADFWSEGADRFCPRHPLLTELGMPAPVASRADVERPAPAADMMRSPGADAPPLASRSEHK